MNPDAFTADPFLERTLVEAISFIGTTETSHNSGPHIDAWLALVNWPSGFSWCSAFLHAMFEAASFDFHINNPYPTTASALHVWNSADTGRRRVTPRRGLVCVLDHGKGQGHITIVEHVYDGGSIEDISGNTNAQGSREGNCVGRHVYVPESGSRGRLLGYLDFSPNALANSAAIDIV